MNWARVAYHAVRRATSARLWPMSDDFAGDPFFIIGSGRCGSTLLRRILTAHPRIYIPPEFGYLGEVVQGYRHRAYREWPQLVSDMLNWYEWERSWNPLFMPLRAKVQAQLEAEPQERRSLARIIETVYTALAQAQDKPGCAWGDKTPANTFHLHEIRELFPQAKFVHMVRDGVDVVASFMHKDKSPDLPHYAARWQTAVRLGRGVVESLPRQAVEVRYEDLVRTPVRALEPVCSLLGVGYEPAMVEELGHVESLGDVVAYSHHQSVTQAVTDASIGKGRRELRPDQLARLQQLIGDDLKAFGYDVAL